MDDIDNEQMRFGSAGFIGPKDPALRPYFSKSPDSLFMGFVGKRKLYWNGMGGALLVAGARAGKLRDMLAYTLLDGTYAGTLLILDMKGELAAISQNQTRGGKDGGGKHCIYWNPSNLHGLPQHRINPVDYIRIDSPSLVSDTKLYAENMIALTGSQGADYFERRGREFLEAIILTLAKIDGVLILPRLYEIINLIPAGSEHWLDFAFEMSESRFEISNRIEGEIAQSRKSTGNGMQGILGEIFKSFAALSDPVLMASVSPPFDFSLSDLCRCEQPYNFYMMPPAEFVDAWGPVMKAMFVAGMIYKSRSASAPRQTWILDECAQLGKFPLVVKLYSYGAGIGIRPLAVFQSTKQMNALGPEAETIITSSAAARIYFALRDIGSAATLSKMLGTQTLEYDDELAQSKAMMAKKAAIRAVLMDGASPHAEGTKLAHYNQAATNRTKQARLLRTPDEVMNTADGKAYLFMDGLAGAIYADRTAYYEQADLAGRFHPNPYHPPLDKVRIKTRFGHRWAKIVRAPVPARFAHYPQYAGGHWSYVEGDE